MTTPRDPIYAGHRYPAEIISYAVWLYFRFPLSLRMVEEMLAARGISVTHETIRRYSSGSRAGVAFACLLRILAGIYSRLERMESDLLTAANRIQLSAQLAKARWELDHRANCHGIRPDRRVELCAFGRRPVCGQ
jgi:putative transposase